MSSSEYVYREEHYEGEDWEDIYITETNSTSECLGEVSYNGQTGRANVSNEVTTRLSFFIQKDATQVEKGLVSGWANIAKTVDGVPPLDWQGDIIEPSELEDAAIAFMKEYRDSGVLHEGGSTGTVVESIVLTKDKQAAMGIPEGTVPEGWFITVQLNDEEVINKVKNGEYKMFSIQGTATREAI